MLRLYGPTTCALFLTYQMYLDEAQDFGPV